MTASPARRHVAFCITELRAGGAERCLVELATRLDCEHFTCSVVSLAPRPTDLERSLVPRLEAAGIPIHFLDATRTLDAPRAVRRLAALWRNDRPDLVQTFLFHANLVGRLAARRANLQPVVSGIRVAERRSKWRLWIDRATAGNVACHVCVSESVARFSREVGRLPAERLTVIPNGIDVARFDNVAPLDRAALGLPLDRRFVVCIGRLDEQKGQRWLLEHAHRWLDQLPEHNLLLVGDGPDRAALEALAREKQLESRVHFLGWTTLVPTILVAADLLVLPSLWEGMPNVLLEAMAARRPIVARQVEGVTELLGPKASGQIVPLDPNPQPFVNAILNLLKNNDLRHSCATENRLRVEAHFSLEAMVRHYESLYSQLLTNSKNVK
jgi:glycosyltransferase involved in cell wall biosynthesis